MTAAVAMKLDGEPIALRAAVPTDLAYVIQTWIRTYKPITRVNIDIFDAEHPRLIKRLLADNGNRLSVACSPDQENTIHGWACGSDDYLHYAYVPAPLRGKGIARKLIEHVLGTYPGRIQVTHRFVNNDEKKTRFVFNPYSLGVTP